MHYSRHLLIVLLASLVLPPVAWAQEPELLLDHSGRLQRVLAGPQGELFDAGDATVPVLAVETVAPGGDLARVLVPGTDDSRLETDPLLFQAPMQDAFVLLWRSQAEDGDVRLDFATFDGAEFSEVVSLEQDGVPVTLAGALRIVETHDVFELELEDGQSISAERMIIHLLWQGDGDAPGTYYAPLAFVAGRYLGWHGVFALDDIFLQASDAPAGDGGDAPEPVELTAALARALDLRVAGDGTSVLVTFANASNDRIGSLEVSPLPLEIGMLGDQVRDGILGLADLYDPEDPSVFSDGIRAAVIIIGSWFDMHDAHAGYVANQVADWAQASGGSYGWADFESLSDDARELAMDATREVTVSSSTDSANPDSDIIRLDVSGLFDDSEDPDPTQVFDVRTLANLPAPAIDDLPAAVFTSHRGDALLIAWLSEDGGQVHWVESGGRHGDGLWSEIFALTLSEQVTVDTARQLLLKRIR